LLFGSLASVVAALAGLMALLTLLAGRRFGFFIQVTLVIATSTVATMLFANPSNFASDYAEPIANLSGKRVEHIMTLTGRVPLWQAVYENTSGMPLGQGFAAADRLFVIVVSSVTEVGWQARSAHNGFISAWMGSGW